MTEKKEKSKLSKIFNIVTWCILIVVLALILYMFIGSVVAKNKKQPFYLFGKYTFNVVATDSMDPAIKVGDMIICKKVSIEKVKATPIVRDENGKPIKTGDYVIFTCINPNITVNGKSILGQPIIHQAIEKTIDGSGAVSIKTQGVNAEITTPDSMPVTEDNFIGVMVVCSSFLGDIAQFFSSTTNTVLVLCGFILFIGAIVIVSKVIKKKKEQKTKAE